MNSLQNIIRINFIKENEMVGYVERMEKKRNA